MVLVPDNVLTLDLDYRLNKIDMEIFNKTREAIYSSLGYTVLQFITHLSASKRGHHIFIHLNKDITDPNEKNFLELLGGSDKTRYIINKIRIKRGVKNWEKIFAKVPWKKPPQEPCKNCKLHRVIRESLNEEGKHVGN